MFNSSLVLEAAWISVNPLRAEAHITYPQGDLRIVFSVQHQDFFCISKGFLNSSVMKGPKFNLPSRSTVRSIFIYRSFWIRAVSYSISFWVSLFLRYYYCLGRLDSSVGWASGFSSGHYLMICELEPPCRALRWQWGACLGFSVSLSLCPFPAPARVYILSKIDQ